MNTTGVAVEGLAEKVAGSRKQILAELRKVIVGQDEVVDEVLMALFCGGHCLITGVPGLAKTLLVKTLAQILDLSFKRIQFTPDLMPADITGTEILDEEHGIARAAVRAGADLRADHPRRRDQPHAAEDAGGAARGDAGVPRHRRGPDLRARAAVLRARDAEPDRARRHLSAARGAARSLPVQRRHDLSLRRRRSAGGDGDDRALRRPEPARVLDGADILAFQDYVRAGAGRRRGRALRGAAGRQLAARPRRQARVRREVGEVGRRACARRRRWCSAPRRAR